MVTTRSQAPRAAGETSQAQAPSQANKHLKHQDPYHLPGKQQESIDALTYNSFYVFEDYATIYRIPVSSLQGQSFSSLTSGSEKIAFLKEHGEKVDKPVKVDKTQMVGAPFGAPRLMIHHQGAWIFWNEGQIEYMVPCGNENGEDSELSKEFERLKDEGMTLDERREGTIRHAVRIRAWPDYVKRVDSGVV